MKKAFLILLTTFSCGLAQAQLAGSQIKAWTHVPPSVFFGPGGDYSVKTFLVGEGTEAPLFGVLNESSLDFQGNELNIDFTRSGNVSFDSGSYEFVILSSGPRILDIHLGLVSGTFANLSSTPVVFSDSRITHTDNSFSINLAGLKAYQGAHLQLDMVFAPVPEPSGAQMLFSGLGVFAGFAAIRRRRRQIVA